MSARNGAAASMGAPTISLSARFRIVERVLGIDDTLYRGIIKRLRLLDVAARADPGLLPCLGLIQELSEGFALAAVGRKLIGSGKNAK